MSSLIGIFGFILFDSIPVIIYFVPYMIFNKTLLCIYTLLYFAIYIYWLIPKNCNDDPNFGLGFLSTIDNIAFSFFYSSFIVGILGIMGKAFILHQESRDNSFQVSKVHTVCLTIIIMLNSVLKFSVSSIFEYMAANFC